MDHRIKSADDILASVKRFCLKMLEVADAQRQIGQTSESGHWMRIADRLQSPLLQVDTSRSYCMKLTSQMPSSTSFMPSL
jgi:hypothetical protein